MRGLRLYGLDEGGQATFAEEIAAAPPAELRRHAERRLRDWHRVEVWDGQVCVIRLSRRRGVAG